ncbi:hypothetical protein C8J56DRAFT_1169626 [Mycena floridula]|nr:hypothetical protein C8J56DRAFT_1169626 [Mycena floridula]
MSQQDLAKILEERFSANPLDTHWLLSLRWSFSDRTVDVQRTWCVVQHMLLRYRVTQSVSAPLAAPVGVIHLSVDPHDDGMPSLVDLSDSDQEPYDSDSESDSDDGMPPLIDLSDSDSGYGSN